MASDNIPVGQTVYFGIIADGVHTHPAALRIAHRTHPDGLVIVTDAISAMGLEEGFHHIGQFDMEVRNHKAYIAGTETLCGSIASMDECIKILKKSTSKCLYFYFSAPSFNYVVDLVIKTFLEIFLYKITISFFRLQFRVRFGSGITSSCQMFRHFR